MLSFNLNECLFLCLFKKKQKRKMNENLECIMHKGLESMDPRRKNIHGNEIVRQAIHHNIWTTN